MNLEAAKACIGCTVETDHAGYKMVRSIAWHGPYILKKVTKAGLCILEGYEQHRVPPSQIRPYCNSDPYLSLDKLIKQLQLVKKMATDAGVDDVKIAMAIPGDFTTVDVSLVYPPVLLQDHPGSFLLLCCKKEPEIWTPSDATR